MHSQTALSINYSQTTAQGAEHKKHFGEEHMDEIGHTSNFISKSFSKFITELEQP